MRSSPKHGRARVSVTRICYGEDSTHFPVDAETSQVTYDETTGVLY